MELLRQRMLQTFMEVKERDAEIASLHEMLLDLRPQLENEV